MNLEIALGPDGTHISEDSMHEHSLYYPFRALGFVARATGAIR